MNLSENFSRDPVHHGLNILVITRLILITRKKKTTLEYIFWVCFGLLWYPFLRTWLNKRFSYQLSIPFRYHNMDVGDRFEVEFSNLCLTVLRMFFLSLSPYSIFLTLFPKKNSKQTWFFRISLMAGNFQSIFPRYFWFSCNFWIIFTGLSDFTSLGNFNNFHSDVCLKWGCDACKNGVCDSIVKVHPPNVM